MIHLAETGKGYSCLAGQPAVNEGRLLLGFFVLLILVLADAVRAQDIGVEDEEGAPYHVEQFSPEDYEAHAQNWAVIQDTSGLLYVGNNNGVLEYDGSKWRFISTPEELPARSLARDSTGRIYVGVVGDFGYLAPDSLGRMEYVSLSDHVPAGADRFRDVWSTSITPDGVYFQSWDRLYRWSDGRVKTWEPKDRFFKSFSVRGTLYVNDPATGLMYLSNDSLEPLPGGEELQGSRVSVVLPYRHGGLLIGTMAGQLYHYRDSRLKRFQTSAGDFFSEASLYHGCMISDSLAALSTLGNGVAVMNMEGRIQRILNSNNGLLDDIVGYVYPDHQGGLWMAMDRGLARIEVPPRMSLYDKRSGLHGVVHDVARYESTLYAGTQYNVYRKRGVCPSSVHSTCFEPVFDEDAMMWNMLSVEDGLLVGQSDGVFLVDGARIRKLAGGNPWFLYPSPRRSDRIYVGMGDGIRTLERREGTWVPGPYHPEVDRDVRSVVEDSSGTLWLGTLDQKVIRIGAADTSFTAAPVSIFSAADGLPEGVVYMVPVADRPAFVTSQGVYRFNGAGGAAGTGGSRRYFRPDSAITAAFDDWSMDLLEVEEDAEGRIWFVFDGEVRVLHRGADGTYRRLPPPALRFGQDQVFSVHAEGPTVWFGAESGLIRYDQQRMKTADSSMPAFVRRVTVNGDSVLYAGKREEVQRNALSYGNRQIRFEYAAPVFHDRETISYQTALTGFDDGWSNWTAETFRTYTNLQEGEYTFRVRARGAYGHTTGIGAFEFSVLPPWYRTWWAYLLYGVILVGVIAGYGRMRADNKTRKLERQRKITEQLKEANAQLEEANRLKDEFLTTISHEFRTPLASMAGFASILEEAVDEDKRHFARYIQESGSRLQETLNSVLDLAKLRAGRVEMSPEPVDVAVRTRGVVQLLEPLAAKKGLRLETEFPEHDVTVYLDAYSFERILNNLISNAIKFTDEGRVTVRVDVVEDKVRVQVEDTGVGITEEFQSKLFDEFRQESTGLSRTHQGVGLGLAITRHLVHLMDADIHVESTKGEGSVFTVIFQRALDRADLRRRQPSV